MADHAKRSLSGSKRRYACPGSVVLEAPYPGTSSKYADAGTVMHEVAAWCVANSQRAEFRVGEEIPVKGGEVLFTDNMAEQVQDYVDAITALGKGKGNRMLIEQRVDVSSITGIADQFGTADCIIVAGDECMVIDLKTGFRPVSPVDNTQLQMYALGALNLLYGQAPVSDDPDHDGQPDAEVVAGGQAEGGGVEESTDELW